MDAVIRTLARRRLARIRRDAIAPGPAQRRLLRSILRRARNTTFAEHNDLRRRTDYEHFVRNVPLRDYGGFATTWARARDGVDVCWPGRIRYWGLSSGTTSGEKLLPISSRTIRTNKRGAWDTLVPALAQRHATTAGGRVLFLGGCTELQRIPGGFAGDNTGIMLRHTPRWLDRWRVPSRSIAADPDWERKIERAAAEARACDIRILTGVPSWILLFAERVLAHTGASTLRDVWPRLHAFVHGGVSFSSFETLARERIGPGVRFVETYSATEGGLLGVQDRADEPGMLPLVDRGAFFELIEGPIDVACPDARPLAEAELGVDYAVALTTDAGIYRYLLGDRIRFIERDPLRFVFAGRVAHTLNGFGEHVSVGELDRAVATAARETDAAVTEFAVAPAFDAGDASVGHHRYLVEFARAPVDADRFARVLDATLATGNADYATHRDYGLGAPQLEIVAPGAFYGWMRARGKLGGQHKVPRVVDAEAADALSAQRVACGASPADRS